MGRLAITLLNLLLSLFWKNFKIAQHFDKAMGKIDRLKRRVCEGTALLKDEELAWARTHDGQKLL